MISIDVSDSYIYVLELKGSSEKINITDYGAIPLKKPIIIGDNGIDKEVLSEHLEGIFEESNSKDVAITYSSLPIISNGYRLPYEKKEKEMREIVKSKAIKSMASDEFVLDYRVSGISDTEDGVFCNVVTYLMQRSIIEDTVEVIKELKKKPLLLHVTQNSIFNFAEHFIDEETVAIVNMMKKKITLHLINFPGNVITRVSNLDESSGLDILNPIKMGETDIAEETISQLSKLVQYQAIKSNGRSIEAIYLMGEMANRETKIKIEQNLEEKVKLLSEINLPFPVRDELFKGYIYALSAAIKPQ